MAGAKRLNLWREKLSIWLAWRLPRSVAFWACLRVGTHGFGGNPGNLRVKEALDMWDEETNERRKTKR